MVKVNIGYNVYCWIIKSWSVKYFVIRINISIYLIFSSVKWVRVDCFFLCLKCIIRIFEFVVLEGKFIINFNFEIER